ncbi:hypothetical protein HU200_029297 [Digitaria exilis]|uniref:DUF295 domain-containing protein n=1 Tax=Digitaria exilis TaxID=1010633 RepID=A0A835BZ07_9POAL|nr:hypothetical protein HU200_029297 [Digitaria exilis]
MATTAPANNAASPRWSDLPFDLLCDISSRLHVATDYIRFHAVCQPWHDTLPPLPCRPAFLPLLLAPADAIGHQTARCIFSPKCSRRRSAAVQIAVGRRVWVMSLDGASTSFFLLAISRESTSLVNPLSGSTVAALPPLPDGVKYVSGVVYVDGTVFLFGLFPEKMAFWTPIFVALLRPGSTVWTSARTHHRLIHDVRNLDRRPLYGGTWSKSPLERCRVFRYSFHEDVSEFVEQLPAQWNCEAGMWFSPQPDIATTEEIKGRLGALNRKAAKPKQQFAADFRIYVGNLSRKLDSHRLQ